MSRVCLTDVHEQARPLPDSNPLDLTDFAGDSGPWRTCSEEKVVEAAGIEPASEYETERATTCLFR